MKKLFPGMLREPTDEDIVQAIRSGADARVNWAIQLLYKKKNYVTSFVWADTQRELYQFNEAFVDDLFQETIVTFLKKVWANQYQPSDKASLKTYLYSISYKKFQNERRKAQNRLDHEQVYSQQETEPLTAEDILFENERVAVVDQLLSQLDNDGGELIRLFEFQQKSHREIGELLGISENAAKMRYHRSRRQLEKILITYGTPD